MAIRSASANLQWELHELEYSSGIERRQGPLDALEFLRHYVARNKPVVLTDCVKDWPALQKWSTEYLSKTIGSKDITVQTTPDGYADAITSIVCKDGTLIECFVEPFDEQMKFDAFLKLLCDDQSSKVPYIQEQNDNFRCKFPELCNDVDIKGFTWAQEAFGIKPEAVNLWIGSNRSVTSFHKDHYENMYVVISGCKLFTLLPPCSTHRLYFREYPHAKYMPNEDGALIAELTVPEHKVQWSPININQSGHWSDLKTSRWPEFYSSDYPAPLTCEVNEGEVLYLPSLWYHHVQQKHSSNQVVVAINYWYDMQYDVKYAYHKLSELIGKELSV